MPGIKIKMWVNARKFNGFFKFRKRVKRIFKNRNRIIKKKKEKKLYTCNMFSVEFLSILIKFYCIIRFIIFSQKFCLEIIMDFKLQFK